MTTKPGSAIVTSTYRYQRAQQGGHVALGFAQPDRASRPVL